MLGFTLPLFIIMGAEALVGILLLCPSPVNRPAIQLTRLSYTQVGSTVFYTVAGVLALLLASPVYDGLRLYYSMKDRPEQANVDLSDQEARTLLSFTLTGACLALMFFIRELGRAQGQLERMALSEAAMLKQVKGLQSEYTRMMDSGAGGTAAKAGTAGTAAGTAASEPAGAGGGELSAGEVAEVRKLVRELEEMNSKLQARLVKVEAAHGEAERNLAALKTQSRGVENEYDRLLAEHDELKRQMAQAGLVGAAAPGDSRMGKKDE